MLDTYYLVSNIDIANFGDNKKIKKMFESGNESKIIIDGQKFNCPIEVTMSFLDGKWKSIVLWYLQGVTLRYSELQKKIPSISQKMLTRELRELERYGFVKRKVYPEVPPKVEYSLTEYGNTLKPILVQLCNWGIQHLDKCGKFDKV